MSSPFVSPAAAAAAAQASANSRAVPPATIAAAQNAHTAESAAAENEAYNTGNHGGRPAEGASDFNAPYRSSNPGRAAPGASEPDAPYTEGNFGGRAAPGASRPGAPYNPSGLGGRAMPGASELGAPYEPSSQPRAVPRETIPLPTALAANNPYVVGSSKWWTFETAEREIGARTNTAEHPISENTPGYFEEVAPTPVVGSHGYYEQLAAARKYEPSGDVARTVEPSRLTLLQEGMLPHFFEPNEDWAQMKTGSKEWKETTIYGLENPKTSKFEPYQVAGIMDIFASGRVEGIPARPGYVSMESLVPFKDTTDPSRLIIGGDHPTFKQQVGDFLEAQRASALFPGSRSALTSINSLNKWAEDLVGQGEEYHNLAEKSGLPWQANPLEYQEDLAVEFMKGAPTRSSEFFSPVSGQIGRLLPGGQGLQGYGWNVLEGKVNAPVSFAKALGMVNTAENRYGPYASLLPPVEHMGNPHYDAGQIDYSSIWGKLRAGQSVELPVFYVPHGNWAQTRLEDVKVSLADSGEIFIYQKEGGYNVWELIGGGGRNAAQSGTFSFVAETPLVYNQWNNKQGVPDLMAEGLNYNDASRILANPHAFSRLGAEAYGGTVQPLDNRVLGDIRYEDVSNRAPWNMAAYVSPMAVNMGKARLPGANAPWEIAEDVPGFTQTTAAGLGGRLAVKPFAAQYLEGGHTMDYANLFNYRAEISGRELAAEGNTVLHPVVQNGEFYERYIAPPTRSGEMATTGLPSPFISELPTRLATGRGGSAPNSWLTGASALPVVGPIFGSIGRGIHAIELDSEIQTRSQALQAQYDMYERSGIIAGGKFLGSQRQYTGLQAEQNDIASLQEESTKAKSEFTPTPENTLWTAGIYNAAHAGSMWWDETVGKGFESLVSPLTGPAARQTENILGSAKTPLMIVGALPIIGTSARFFASDNPLFPNTPSKVSEASQALVGVPGKMIEFAGMVPPGVESIARNPMALPALAASGLLLQGKGMWEGMTTRPTGFVYEQVGMLAATDMAFRGISSASPIGGGRLEVPSAVKGGVSTNFYAVYSKMPFAAEGGVPRFMAGVVRSGGDIDWLAKSPTYNKGVGFAVRDLFTPGRFPDVVSYDQGLLTVDRPAELYTNVGKEAYFYHASGDSGLFNELETHGSATVKTVTGKEFYGQSGLYFGAPGKIYPQFLDLYGRFGNPAASSIIRIKATPETNGGFWGAVSHIKGAARMATDKIMSSNKVAWNGNLLDSTAFTKEFNDALFGLEKGKLYPGLRTSAGIDVGGNLEHEYQIPAGTKLYYQGKSEITIEGEFGTKHTVPVMDVSFTPKGEPTGFSYSINWGGISSKIKPFIGSPTDILAETKFRISPSMETKDGGWTNIQHAVFDKYLFENLPAEQSRLMQAAGPAVEAGYSRFYHPEQLEKFGEVPSKSFSRETIGGMANIWEQFGTDMRLGGSRALRVIAGKGMKAEALYESDFDSYTKSREQLNQIYDRSIPVVQKEYPNVLNISGPGGTTHPATNPNIAEAQASITTHADTEGFHGKPFSTYPYMIEDTFFGRTSTMEVEAVGGAKINIMDPSLMFKRKTAGAFAAIVQEEAGTPRLVIDRAKDLGDAYAVGRAMSATLYKPGTFDFGGIVTGMKVRRAGAIEEYTNAVDSFIKTLPKAQREEALGRVSGVDLLHGVNRNPRATIDIVTGQGWLDRPAHGWNEEAVFMPGKRAGVDFQIEKTQPTSGDWKTSGQQRVKDVIGKENVFFHATDIDTIRNLEETGAMFVNSEGKGIWGTGHLHFAAPRTIDMQFLGSDMNVNEIKVTETINKNSGLPNEEFHRGIWVRSGGIIKIVESPTAGNPRNSVASVFNYEKPGGLRAVGRMNSPASEFVVPKGTRLDYVGTTFMKNPMMEDLRSNPEYVQKYWPGTTIPEDWIPVAEVKISDGSSTLRKGWETPLVDAIRANRLGKIYSTPPSNAGIPTGVNEQGFMFNLKTGDILGKSPKSGIKNTFTEEYPTSFAKQRYPLAGIIGSQAIVKSFGYSNGGRVKTSANPMLLSLAIGMKNYPGGTSRSSFSSMGSGNYPKGGTVNKIYPGGISLITDEGLPGNYPPGKNNGNYPFGGTTSKTNHGSYPQGDYPFSEITTKTGITTNTGRNTETNQFFGRETVPFFQTESIPLLYNPEKKKIPIKKHGARKYQDWFIWNPTASFESVFGGYSHNPEKIYTRVKETWQGQWPTESAMIHYPGLGKPRKRGGDLPPGW